MQRIAQDNDTDNEPRLCSIYSNDANYQASNLTDWDQEFDQISDGYFLGSIDEIHFEGVHVFKETTNRSLRQQCRVNNPGIWLGFSSDNKSCLINNRAAPSDQFLCMPSGQDFELLTPDHFSIFGIVLNQQQLSEAVGDDIDLTSNHDELWLNHLCPTRLMDFRNYLTALLSAQHPAWSCHTHEVILRDAVFDLLYQSKLSGSNDTIPAQRQRVIARIKEYLNDAQLQSPITITDICQAVHVSRRSLQDVFNACFGISPKRYIHMLRLNQVRRALLQSSNNNTVADIAFNFGFFHLGQFSQDYKRLFGECPSDTAKRQRVNSEQPISSSSKEIVDVTL
ncbi:helix-turn-helix domain-containing protein [Vibrio hippocampi]|uniref:HTH-type transcriptional activator RhaR n=1 Tax=Vibrio hippocampi TaxID=654686 RepID=A0ABN8DIG3_9VIBR|nr:helix-turn-helix domain-containing protein [Vibrio hippocampi]CAH0525796.1 HTH-type transcriptional activator RhaR [Vibrio hippocampi]